LLGNDSPQSVTQPTGKNHVTRKTLEKS